MSIPLRESASLKIGGRCYSVVTKYLWEAARELEPIMLSFCSAMRCTEVVKSLMSVGFSWTFIRPSCKLICELYLPWILSVCGPGRVVFLYRISVWFIVFRLCIFFSSSSCLWCFSFIGIFDLLADGSRPSEVLCLLLLGCTELCLKIAWSYNTLARLSFILFF